jgi:hypothetical protein
MVASQNDIHYIVRRTYNAQTSFNMKGKRKKSMKHECVSKETQVVPSIPSLQRIVCWVVMWK